MTSITPFANLRITQKQIPAYEGIPNTSLSQKPLLIYHSAFHEEISASEIEAHLRSVGEVSPQWRYTMYPQTHFHSTTHEVLCVSSGSAKLCFGHEANPGRFESIVSKGDVIIVPAGVGHRLLDDHGGFQMVGSYPMGKDWDMCYGNKGEALEIAGITKLDWFKLDPIYGLNGPIHDI